MFYEITFSPTGGTKKSADLLSAAWDEKVEIDLMKRQDDFSKYTFTAEDICLVAVPSFGGRVPAVATERLSRMQGGGAKAILVVVYGNRAYEDTFVDLEDTLKAGGFQPVGGAAVVAEHSIFREFAAGRPDAADEAQLKEWSQKLKEKAEEGGSVSFPGNRPYKKYGAIPMTPKAKSCQGCGKCVSRCPVGAIPGDRPNETDSEKCITCMACVAVCPMQARRVNPIALAGAKAMLKKALTGRKENELFV
ncbi:MAG: 4Fe-4S binding protein [Anaerotignum sp.]|nr:4Fe-4S binding protein [Anaerotignum sp.]